MKHSDFSLIPIFTTIAEEKNFSKAAARLNISQAAVSQSVKKLRLLYQDPLFIRGKNGVSLTHLANDLYSQLATSVSAISATHPKHKSFNPKLSNKTFKIASLGALSHTLHVEVFRLIYEKAPNISVSIDPLPEIDLVNKLRHHEYDIVLNGDIGFHPELKSQILFEEKLCCIYRADHPRLNCNQIDKEKFLSEQHIVQSQIGNIDSFFSKNNIEATKILSKRNIAWQVNSLMDILPLIQESDYIALFPISIAKKYLRIANIKWASIDFMDSGVIANMYWHPCRSNDASHQWLRKQIELAGNKVAKYQSL